LVPCSGAASDGWAIVGGSAGRLALTDRIVTDRELAEALLATEMQQSGEEPGTARTPNGSDAGVTLASGERVLERLQGHLLGWFGPDGVDALLIRALERTRGLHPILAGVQRPVPGTLRLAGIAEAPDTKRAPNGKLDNHEVSEGIVALLAAILALIGRLVGDEMMQHLVRQIWPALPDDMPSPHDSSNNNERSGK
jgi:hypothetical protein